MSSKLYLTNLPANYTPATMRGAWDDTAGAVTRALDVTKEGGGAITTVARANTNASATYDVLLYRGISGPLAAQTISGTLNVMLGVIESNALANFFWHVHVYATQGDSDTPRGTLLNDYIEATNEWGTAAATNGKAFASAQTLAGVGILDGDRIVIEIGYIDTEGSATSRTGTLNYGTLDPTLITPANDLTAGAAGANLAGFVEFSATLAEYSAGIKARLTQSMLKVLHGGDDPKARLTQSMLKVLHGGAPKARLTQAMLKVLRSTANLGGVGGAGGMYGGGGGGGAKPGGIGGAGGNGLIVITYTPDIDLDVPTI
jgi:hypothetical protein